MADVIPQEARAIPSEPEEPKWGINSLNKEEPRYNGRHWAGFVGSVAAGACIGWWGVPDAKKFIAALQSVPAESQDSLVLSFPEYFCLAAGLFLLVFKAIADISASSKDRAGEWTAAGIHSAKEAADPFLKVGTVAVLVTWVVRAAFPAGQESENTHWLWARLLDETRLWDFTFLAAVFLGALVLTRVLGATQRPDALRQALAEEKYVRSRNRLIEVTEAAKAKGVDLKKADAKGTNSAPRQRKKYATVKKRLDVAAAEASAASDAVGRNWKATWWWEFWFLPSKPAEHTYELDTAEETELSKVLWPNGEFPLRVPRVLPKKDDSTKASAASPSRWRKADRA